MDTFTNSRSFTLAKVRSHCNYLYVHVGIVHLSRVFDRGATRLPPRFSILSFCALPRKVDIRRNAAKFGLQTQAAKFGLQTQARVVCQIWSPQSWIGCISTDVGVEPPQHENTANNHENTANNRIHWRSNVVAAAMSEMKFFVHCLSEIQEQANTYLGFVNLSLGLTVISAIVRRRLAFKVWTPQTQLTSMLLSSFWLLELSR